MRKKTIEEELKEIAAEKDDHIEQLEKQFGHSKAHRYDFSSDDESSKKSKRNYTVRGVNVTKAQYDELQKDFNELAKTEAEMNNAKNELAKMKAECNSAINGLSSEDKFTIEDYKKMVELEERELSDEEFDEYYNLCDRFGDLSDELRDKLEDLYDILYSSKTKSELLSSNRQTTTAGSSYSQLQNTTRTTSTRHQSVGSFIFPIIFLCFFVAAGLGVTIFAGIIPWSKSGNYVPVTATVQKIQDTWREDGYLYADLLVSFEFEEEIHNTVISKRVQSSIQEGSTTLTIYVNKTNVKDVKANNDGGYAFPTFFGIVFAGFALLMQTMLIVQAIKAKKQNRKI